MHDKIMQAKKSHSKTYFNQRTDPHHLVPERPTEFAFERVVPVAKTCNSRLNQEYDHKDQDTFDGNNIVDDTGFNPLQSSPEPRNVQESFSGEDAAKRSHDSIVHTGHRVRPSKVQKMNNTAAVQETLQKEAEPVEQDDRVHARYMQRIKDRTPTAYEQLMQSKSNLLNQGVNTQSDLMNQSSSVDNAFTQAEAFSEQQR
jgi:hypothetical protein